MRQRLIISLGLLLAMLASCTKEEVREDAAKPDVQLRRGSVEFILECEDEGKSVLNGLKSSFEAGDEIAIWDGTSLNKFTAIEVGDSLIFTGDAAKADCYWALYPWSESCTVSTTSGTPVFKTGIPQEQVARSGSFSSGAAVSIGKTSAKGKILMRNVCGFLKFNFPATTLTIRQPGSLSKVKLTSLGGSKLSGNFSVGLDTSGLPVVSEAALAQGDSTAVITFPDNNAEAGATYVFAVLPSDLSAGIRLDFERTGDCAKASKTGGKKAGNVLARNSLVNLKELAPQWKAAEEEADDSSSDPSGAFDYSAISATSHPRLYMSDQDWKTLKRYVADGSYPALSYRHQKAIAYADALYGKKVETLAELKVREPRFNRQKSLHLSISKDILTILANNSYAYRMTGEKKYFDECIRIADQACADSSWYPESFLSTAEITLGVSLMYDWLYYDLSLTERAKLRDNLINKGIKTRKSGTTNDKSNRGQVYNAALMAASLAVYEKDKATAYSLMQESDSRYLGILEKVYNTTGSSFEGYGYWEYGANFSAVYLELLNTVFGNCNGYDKQEGFSKTGDYMLFMADHLQSFPYADGGSSQSPSSRVPLWWLAAHYNQPHILANELYRDSKGFNCNDRLMFQVPCALSKYPKMDLSSISFPSYKVWVDDNSSLNPVIMARTSWNNNESDKYLGIKGGYAATGHGHMDVGSFVYHASGKVWSTDVGHKTYSEYSLNGLGGSGQYTPTAGYEAPIWDAMAYNSLGHSTISFSNYSGSVTKLHPTDHMVSSSAKATILESYTSGSDLGGKLNLTPLFTGQVASATRKVTIHDNHELRVEDQITALSGSSAKYIYRLVTPAQVEVKDNYVILTNGNVKQYLTMECTSGSISSLTAYNWGTFAESRPAVGTWGWTTEAKWDETHSANVTGFTLTIPKGTSVTLLSKISPDAPGSSGINFSGETPDFNDDNYKW